jgi:hypothetical protein
MDEETTNAARPADASSAKKTDPKDLAEEVGLPPRPVAEPPPPTSPTGNLESDMARIVEETRLPTRNEYRAAADAPVKQQAAAGIPLEGASAESVSETPPEEKEPAPRDPMSAVHTFKDDLQTVVHEKKISLVQAAALEADKRAHLGTSTIQGSAPKQPHPRVFGPIAIALVFVILGAIILGAVFLVIRDRAGVPNNTFLADGLLFAEQTIPFSIHKYSATELKRLLADTRSSSNLTLGAITQLVPVVQAESSQTGAPVEFKATTRQFLAAIDAHAPDELLRALSDEFFFGFHTVDENAPMLVIPVTSYERAFAGMLQWETTINADLAPIFTGVPPLVQNANGLLTQRTFEDDVMRNFDVRILKDDAGVVQLFYSFPTRELLIISESPYSFAEILSRLRADRRL